MKTTAARQGATKRRVKRRASKDTKGILLRNPIVAAQVGAAAGSFLAAMYVEKPTIFNDLEPIIDTFGRTREREDLCAYLALMTGPRSKWPLSVKTALLDLDRALRSNIHVGAGKSRYAEALNKQIGPLQEMLGIHEWTRNDKKETR